MKATDERAMVGECVSEPTLPQCFSGVSQDAIWGVATDRVPVPWVLPCRMPQGERKPPTNDPETVSVSRVGTCYVASIGRVRVAGACPLRALADACEWSRVFG